MELNALNASFVGFLGGPSYWLYHRHSAAVTCSTFVFQVSFWDFSQSRRYLWPILPCQRCLDCLLMDSNPQEAEAVLTSGFCALRWKLLYIGKLVGISSIFGIRRERDTLRSTFFIIWQRLNIRSSWSLLVWHACNNFLEKAKLGVYLDLRRRRRRSRRAQAKASI